MNDDELITAVQESFADVHSDTSVEQIVSRGRGVRARRHVPGVAAAVGAAAVAAVALAVAQPASHPATSPPTAGHPSGDPGPQPAAFTVERQDDGSIRIDFFGDLRDPAGLERTLRADGLPASVTFFDQLNSACHAYPYRNANSPEPFTALLGGAPDAPDVPNTTLVIHLKAMPPGSGLQIAVRALPPQSSGPSDIQPEVEVGLVEASPQCTGN